MTRVQRRAFLMGPLALLAAPLAAEAQESGKAPRIGVLGPRTRSDAAPFLDAFLQGLRELGWTEGKNIVIEYRWAAGRADRLPALAAELVRLKVDLIHAGNTSAAVAARNATSTIPIVMATGGDPVGLGLVASLARPGGNVTGLSYSVSLETIGKQLELLKEVVPKVRRVAVLTNPTNPSHALAVKQAEAWPSRWECRFSSWRPEVPTSSTVPLRRWAERARGLSLWYRIQSSVFSARVSRTWRQGAVSR
jgi:putative ABC transport system substrate-binding protein